MKKAEDPIDAGADMDLILRDGWMCESHPGHPWPDCPAEQACPGPGTAWIFEGHRGRKAVETLMAQRSKSSARE